MEDIVIIETTGVLPDRAAAVQLGGWIEEMNKPLFAVPTTIAGIDEITGGFSGLTVLGGDPGAGKTALAIQAAETYALKGGPVLFFSFEMGVDGVFSRLFQRQTGVAVKDHRAYLQANPEAGQRLEKLAGEMPNLWLFQMPKLGEEIEWDKIQTGILEAKEMTGKTPFVVVDSLHTTPMGDKAKSFDNIRLIQETVALFGQIKQATGAAILLIAHKTKQAIKDKSNSAIDFSGSVKIGYDVDVAIQLETKNTDNGIELYVHIPKNRGYTPKTDIKVSYNREYQTME